MNLTLYGPQAANMIVTGLTISNAPGSSSQLNAGNCNNRCQDMASARGDMTCEKVASVSHPAQIRVPDPKTTLTVSSRGRGLKSALGSFPGLSRTMGFKSLDTHGYARAYHTALATGR
jgi:hypothetical protein